MDEVRNVRIRVRIKPPVFEDDLETNVNAFARFDIVTDDAGEEEGYRCVFRCVHDRDGDTLEFRYNVKICSSMAYFPVPSVFTRVGAQLTDERANRWQKTER